MEQIDHGRCPKCRAYCGCSFQPTSMSDYCSTHRPRLSKIRQSSKESASVPKRDSTNWKTYFQQQMRDPEGRRLLIEALAIVKKKIALRKSAKKPVHPWQIID